MNPTQIAQYQILDKLGAGGMGSVYLGRHTETKQVAAIKVLPASLAQEDGFIDRFAREIDALRKLNNPHIVKLFESGVDGETYYYAMEYVAGETVLSLLRREKKLSWEKAFDIGVQVCRALKAAHDTGIIHRDLKPSNLLITPEGLVMLTDFGVAQVFASTRLTVTGGIIGTAEYMSPEQAQGKRATKQSDLYSLGAVLYALITGRPPFSGNTAIDVIQKHKFGQFEKPRTLVPDLPHWVEEILIQLLEKDPAKRPPNAMVLQRRMEEVVRKIELSKGGDTLAGDDLGGSDPDAPTIAQPYRSDDTGALGVGPATLMKDLLRAEIEHAARETWWQRILNHTAVLIALLALVIAGGVWWFSRPPVRTIVNTEEADDEDMTTAPASEPQRQLQQAVRLRKAGEIEQAERILTALAALLTDDPESKAVQKRAKIQLKLLKNDRARAEAERLEFLKQQLERAGQFVEEGNVEGAQRLWSSMVELYGDSRDPAVAEIVNKARAALQSPPSKQAAARE